MASCVTRLHRSHDHAPQPQTTLAPFPRGAIVHSRVHCTRPSLSLSFSVCVCVCVSLSHSYRPFPGHFLRHDGRGSHTGRRTLRSYKAGCALLWVSDQEHSSGCGFLPFCHWCDSTQQNAATESRLSVIEQGGCWQPWLRRYCDTATALKRAFPA